MLRIMLQRQGSYDVEAETNAIEAIARARAFKPDLVFLDINMPNHSGLEIASRLREIPWFRARPILFFCGMPDIEERWAKAVVAPPAEFLRKGTPLSKIVEVVERLLAQSSSPYPAFAVSSAANAA